MKTSINESTENPMDVPKWDIALEALLVEEFHKKETPVTLDDMRRLATLHAIRFDDIIDSLLVMCLEGVWKYTDEAGRVQPISAEDVERLFASGRVDHADLAAYTGGWSPVA
ncbi:MAG: hypothetical protein AB1810_12800 [Pseudomonadota bacterium]